MNRRSLLLCAAIALAIAVLLAVSGGFRFTVGGFRVSVRSPIAPSLIALLAFGAWARLASLHDGVASDLARAWSALEQSTWPAVIVVAASSAGLAIAFGTFAAAGADASGYLSQAAMWASGHVRVPDPLVTLAGWPADAGITAPLGWNASLDRGWQVPTYGPGLPLLMALPGAAGDAQIASLIVAFSAAIAVLASSAIAWRLSGGTGALVTAVTLATCPVFVFQSTQPMSDVPVTAAWMACWWFLIVPPADARAKSDELRRGHAEAAFGRPGVSRIVFAGMTAAVAVLIRPNLAPLAIVPLLYLLLDSRRSFGTLRPLGTRHVAPGTFAIPVALSGVFLAWLQWRWYGSPFRSGYGTVEQLYSLAYIAPNMSRYATWLISTAPVLLAALAGLWFKRGSLTWALLGFALLNTAAYLVYFVFNEWSYLRFLLPALAVAAVFVGVAVAALVDRLPASLRAFAVITVTLTIAGLSLSQARALDVFRLADVHRRVLQIDRYLDAVLPPGAVIVSGEQSGAVRFDTGHDIVRWEAASREDLERMLTILEHERRPVWILLDAWEEPLLRERFAGAAAAALDWPPAVDAGESHRTRAWSLNDRARYLNGERVITDRLR